MKRYSLWAKLGLAAASVLVTGVVIEVFFRVVVIRKSERDFARALEASRPADNSVVTLGHIIQKNPNPRIIYELKPNLDVVFRGQQLRTNSAGFRGPSVALEKPPGTVRIVGIGDSVMFGWGVAWSDAYLPRLAALLNAQPGGRTVDIVNTAVPGYNTVMEVATLAEKGLAYHPDIVMLGFTGNDLMLPNFVWDQHGVSSSTRSVFLDWLLNRVGIIETGFDPTLRSQDLRSADRDFEGSILQEDLSAIPPRYRDLVGWPAVEGALRDLQRLGRDSGFTVIAVFFKPVETEIKTRAMALADELGFTIVDVGIPAKRFMEERGISVYVGSELTLSADDPHPSPMSHRLAAEALAEVVLDCPDLR